MPKKILFILHEATESGAPLVAFSFMQWLKKNTDVQFDCYVISQGSLLPKLIEVCENVFQKPPSKQYRVREKLQRFITQNKITHEESFFKVLTDKNYDLIYLNSIFSIPEFRKIEKYFLKPKKILHLHEAQFLISFFEKLFPEINPAENIDYLIAVSETAKKHFLKKYSHSAERTAIVYPYVEKPLNPDINIKKIRQQLGIKEETFVIGNIGNPHLVKSSEMLPILASNLKKKYPDFNFKLLVVGGGDDNIFSLSNRIDAEKLQVDDKIVFINHQSDIVPYLQIMDLYAMISREESFSLMTVLAALSNVPVISFKNNGGPEELLNEDIAFFTDYLDCAMLADKIYIISQNSEKRQSKAQKAHAHFQQFFSGETGNEKLWSISQNL
ncbi:D-inositol 3-phosphate glycosyltransferase [Chryseobacterium aquaeductus]|uniref:D-inositol 3-phosphate glycosyltransferase n=1 Tax=Chryseobacterium aquaeductus TaxID=2675056 RepID=A0A9N8MF91_9FLAO|nr:glycosyltransferase family 4 protein [Chryseobacterium aquaeductus]CAA7330485.1 D-inositol 3-phosphate glycosyltransferase [Chryseobacterium potabilaquae]CAD7803967.1 D-inositol 3-phosphate glycosyltransferase [Chryseobacterium aquaeductus]